MALDPRATIAQLLEHVAELEARPLAKAAPDARTEARCSMHAVFIEAIDRLEELGWSRTKIANHIGCDLTTLGDWYESGDKRRSQLPLWILRRLPIEARAIVARALLALSEPPPSESGADAA